MQKSGLLKLIENFHCSFICNKMSLFIIVFYFVYKNLKSNRPFQKCTLQGRGRDGDEIYPTMQYVHNSKMADHLRWHGNYVNKLPKWLLLLKYWRNNSTKFLISKENTRWESKDWTKPALLATRMVQLGSINRSHRSIPKFRQKKIFLNYFVEELFHEKSFNCILYIAG